VSDAHHRRWLVNLNDRWWRRWWRRGVVDDLQHNNKFKPSITRYITSETDNLFRLEWFY
jgi:hypothetical protein